MCDLIIVVSLLGFSAGENELMRRKALSNHLPQVVTHICQGDFHCYDCCVCMPELLLVCYAALLINIVKHSKCAAARV